MGWQIAIDGPAASGKSTISKIIAKNLGFEYLDTGAMYRAITLKALRLNIDIENEDEYTFLDDTTLDFVDDKLLMDGEDVSKEIRSLEVTNNVSASCKLKCVRDSLVALQRKIASEKNIILDGRDIGTVVLPNANLKIFLSASSKVRAQRRMKEREESGIFLSLEETIKEIDARDYKDSHREIGPLTQADDAIFIDTSEFTIEEVVERITRLVLERGYRMENLEQKVNIESQEEAKDEEVQVEESQVEEVQAEEVQAEEDQQEEKATYKEMQIVEGTVVEVQEAQPANERRNIKAKEERVLFELADGQEGFLFRKDCADIADDEDLFDKFIPGDVVKLAIKKIFPDGGKFIFSTLLVEKHDKLVEFENTIKDRPIITCKVIKPVADFGLLMKYEDFTCLLPTQLATEPKEEFESLVGKELEVVPIRVDLSRIRIIVSQAHAQKKKEKAERKEFVNQIQVGQVYDGVVKNIEKYGAFVEIYPGVEGLLHISELDHVRVAKVEKVLNSGDSVKVQVITVEKDHIGLSRKALLPNHWANYFAEKQIGDVVTGKVLEINKAGVRVNLAEEIEGFVPKSEYSWDREAQIEDSVEVGAEITGKLIEVEKSKRRIIISVKQLSSNPWDEVKVAVGDTLEVKVTKALEDGFRVEYEGLKGYMAKGALPKAVAFDSVKEGDTLKVKVRVFDAAKQRFTVSMRDAEEPKVEKESYAKYMKSSDKPSNTFGDYLQNFNKNDK